MMERRVVCRSARVSRRAARRGLLFTGMGPGVCDTLRFAGSSRPVRRLALGDRMRARVIGKIVGATVLAAAALAAATSAHAVEQGDRAPAWMRTDFDNRPVMFPGVLAGRPAVVVFWAT